MIVLAIKGVAAAEDKGDPGTNSIHCTFTLFLFLHYFYIYLFFINYIYFYIISKKIILFIN